MKISKEDMAHYLELMQNGQTDDASFEFYQKYIDPEVESYSENMKSYLQEAMSEITPKRQDAIVLGITAASTGLASLIMSNVSEFIKAQFASKKDIIESAKISVITEKQMVETFNNLTKEAMNRTATNLITNIRNIQRAILVDSATMKKRGVSQVDIDYEMSKFAKRIKSRFPDYHEMQVKGNFLLDRTGRAMNLNSYIDMSISTTVLNVDRAIVESQTSIAGDRVVEYYLAHVRKLKGNSRAICQRIIENKISGKSLLALDQETADKLGIMTVEEAKNTPDYAMGINCRHSIRAVSMSFQKEIGAA